MSFSSFAVWYICVCYICVCVRVGGRVYCRNLIRRYPKKRRPWHFGGWRLGRSWRLEATSLFCPVKCVNAYLPVLARASTGCSGKEYCVPRYLLLLLSKCTRLRGRHNEDAVLQVQKKYGGRGWGTWIIGGGRARRYVPS